MNMRDKIQMAVKELVENYEDFDDRVLEVHDAALELVPIYDANIIEEWTEVPEYDSDNYEGEHNIILQMVAVLHDWYYAEIVEALQEIEDEEE